MSCEHLEDFKMKFGVDPYKTICNFFIPSKFHNGASKPHYHQVWIACFSCGSESARIFSCMQCIFLGCFGDHIQEHAEKKDHILYVEMSNGFIFCSTCQDYVYDTDFEEIVTKHHAGKRKFGDPVQYVKWQPSLSEDKVLKQHKKRVKLLTNPVEGVSAVKGMRGMVNLGSTCFMNCIMQALLHTPMLRDYFFTDKHNCYAHRRSECLVCHFGRLFQKYYTEDPTTLSLHEILYLVWQNAHHLSGYEQKDAHEFFIAALNLLHQHSSPTSITNEPCTCIIDVIFHGKMQSDLVCQSCGNISTTIDPIWDISLDIPDPPAAASLNDCLHHFTRAEPLGSSAKIKCTVCQTYQESTKQLTFRTLPIVIVIHLKRFEHDNSRHKKKTMYVHFPIGLDMSPFMSGFRNQSEVLHEMPSQREAEFPDMDNRYTLYAVIVHTGTLDTGHYLAYIRHTRQRWFKCSDVCVDPAGVEEVMASEGYLLFYHKTVLTYD